jgi:chemotaxis protein methyltransferase CheR
MDDEQFRRLLVELDRSWPGYRKVRKGVKKRIRRHMLALGCRDLDAYRALLAREPQIRQQCEWLMMVTISRFFREQRLWQMLEAEFLPLLLQLHPAPLRVWSAGCAGGEEPYSFKIIWQQLARQNPHLPRLELIASDTHPQALERAAAGIYPAGSLKELGPQIRLACFEAQKAGRRYRIHSDLKAGIEWVRHDLRDDPLPGPFQIILLRNNLLTYYSPAVAVPALLRISTRLAAGGLLIIGQKETLPGPVRGQYQPADLPYVCQKAC